MKTKPKNFRDVAIKSKELLETFEEELDASFEDLEINMIFMLKFWFDNVAKMQEFTMSDVEVQKLLKSGEKFDLCIIEFLFNESLLGFGPQFGCKIIAVSTIGQMKYINDMIHNPLPLSTTPHPFLSLSDKMSFMQRLDNVLVTTVENLAFWFYHYPLQEAIYDKYFTSEKPSFYTMLKHSVSLVLLNTHFSLNFPQAYLPNMASLQLMITISFLKLIFSVHLISLIRLKLVDFM